jgi:formyl-CoA transferase
MLDFQATRWLMDKEVAKPAGNAHPTGSPTGMYRTSDGYINISASDKVMWRRLCKAMDLDVLVEDPHFVTLERRLVNRAELARIIGDVFATRSTGEWLERFAEGEVSAGPVYSIDQVFADPQVQHLGIARTAEHPRLGPLKLVAQPIHLSEARGSETLGPTPEVGEHNAAILASLGYSEAQIDDLKTRGVL